jgi:hypothetical protein
MKTLFFVVMLMNVALFMWEYKTGAWVPAAATSEQHANGGQEQILLVSELKNSPQAIPLAPVAEPPPPLPVAEKAPAVAVEKPVLTPEPLPELLPVAPPAVIAKPALQEPAAADSGGSSVERCYEAGPLAGDKIYRALARRLKELNGAIKPISRDEQVPGNYFVYYPAAATPGESAANIAMLKSKGIKDLWVLSGEDSGKISLGLFPKEDGALIMKNQLLAKGINAEVKAKYKTRAQKYVLIKSDGKLMENLDDIRKTYPELAVKPIQDAPQGCW